MRHAGPCTLGKGSSDKLPQGRLAPRAEWAQAAIKEFWDSVLHTQCLLAPAASMQCSNGDGEDDQQVKGLAISLLPWHGTSPEEKWV